MLECNRVSTPMSTSTNLQIDPTAPFLDINLYRRIVGRLKYLAFRRPDLSYAVNKLAQFMHSPQSHHWQAIKRLLRYLQHKLTLGLAISRHNHQNLIMYSDFDWAGNPTDRASTTGYILFHGSNPIRWSSKKQKKVA